MSANLTLDGLKAAVEDGRVDTVLACIVDMQGRLMGKRFHARNFIEHSWEETHCCNYLLATDMEMYTVDGYKATSWAGGYGDYQMKPDLSTLRLAPWLEGTAMVLCDVQDHHGHEAIAHSPRAMLRQQVERLAGMGLVAQMATELEFFIFDGGFDELRKSGYRELVPISGYNQDYHILQTTKEEAVMRSLRNTLYAAGIPVENTKGEAETGQEELNIRYAPAMDCADHHSIAKHATKEIAWSEGLSVSFMAKWHHDKVGSSSHVHQSLWTPQGASAFYDASAEFGMSDTMRAYLAGLIKYAPEYIYFLAPYINSYKRFQKGTFAPTKSAWSVDNRTAAFRLCGEGTPAVRVECRLGGADINPYLALAAQIAAGIKGLEEKLELEPPFEGDLYQARRAKDLPRSLRVAGETLRKSKMLREAFGDDVVEHYVRAAQWEQEEFDRVVTDYEVARGFERA